MWLNKESVNHLFLTCNIAYQVWNMCGKWMEITFVHHVNLKQHFQQFVFQEFDNKGNTI